MASDSGTWVSQTEQARIFCPALTLLALLGLGLTNLLKRETPIHPRSNTSINLIKQ